MKGTGADCRLGYRVQEASGEAPSTEGVVAHQSIQHRRLHGKHHCQRGMNDTLALSADAIDPNGVAAVTFEKNVNVDILAVQPTDNIENAALRRYDCRPAVVFGKNGCQLFTCHIVHKQAQGLHRSECGNLRSFSVQFFLCGVAFRDLVHKGAFFLFHCVQLHLALDNLRTQLTVCLPLILFNRGHHPRNHGRFTLCRRQDDNKIQVDWFSPVCRPTDGVFALSA
ncbi:hypothetical protein SDC9_119314 [bioreactor metagenome]|uniref:Uncharacterized protein n=1 Tax=bioreactor metagenome TaxID=1076179 RepID=A0A645C5T5_9ZZZZ